MANGHKRFDTAAPALVSHLIYFAGAIVAGIFALGILYSTVLATDEKAGENSAKIQTLEQTINIIASDQKVLIQRFDDEKEDNKEFRDRTSRALDRILERLPRSNND